MKFKVNATALNGKAAQVDIELYVETLNINYRRELKNKLITAEVYQELQNQILMELRQIYPQQHLEIINFKLISRELEELIGLKFKVKGSDLKEAIIATIYNYLAVEIGFGYQEDVKQPEVYLRQNESRFIARFLSSPEQNISSSKLQEAMDSYQEKRFAQASDIIKEINPDELNYYDRSVCEWLSFVIRTKQDKEDSPGLREQFDQVCQRYSQRPSLIKKYYFSYIEFLENIRDAEKPRELIQEFEARYPLSILDDDEAVIYHRLKGRAEYHRGEYLIALEHFGIAMIRVDKSDLKSKAAIFNSAVNCFTDNLFFESAHWIASQAQEWRRVLDLPQTYESVSCMAGVETKRKNYAQALELHHKADELIQDIQITDIDANRHYNFMAKNYILAGNYARGEEYLDKAEEAGDHKGFTQSLRMLLYYQQSSYDQMDELFERRFKAESKYDHFVLGWANALMARAAFVQKRFDAAISYLEDSISLFMSDLYILEARMVSLYGFAFDPPKEYQDKIMGIIINNNIDARFEEYVAKHAEINSKYYHFFNPDAQDYQEEPELIRLAETVRKINNNKYDAHEVALFIDSYCLY